jgi:Ig-like domain from next to BRCA1 gene
MRILICPTCISVIMWNSVLRIPQYGVNRTAGLPRRRMIMAAKMLRVMSLFFLAGILLAACGVFPTIGGGDQATPSAVPPSPALTEETPARVDSVEIRMAATSLGDIQVAARGTFPDSCTTFARTTTDISGTTFRVTISTARSADGACSQDPVPFEEVFPLDTRDLPPGVYTVEVNGFSTGFVIEENATPVQEKGSISGIVWHDMCASVGGEDLTPFIPTTGCVRTAASSYRADGSHANNEPGISGVLIDLGTGPCPSSGFGSTTTRTDGSFTFPDLAPGTYCISIDPLRNQNVTILVPGDWTYPFGSVDEGIATDTTVVVSGIAKENVDFGWDYQNLPEVHASATPTITPAPTILTPTPLNPTPTAIGSTLCDWAQLVKELGVANGTTLAPGSQFSRTWQLKNIGTCSWTKSYTFVFRGTA